MSRELSLTANVEGAALFMQRRSSSTFASLREKIFERDNHTCNWCGFRARKYQEVVNVDGDFRNNKLANLATACIFCTHAQLLGLKVARGKLIYLPELSQAELNQFVRILFCAIELGSDYGDTAKPLLQGLKHRVSIVDEHYGRNSSDPRVFAQSLVDANIIEKRQQTQIMQGLRWLPNRNDFDKPVAYWANNIITRDELDQRLA